MGMVRVGVPGNIKIRTHGITYTTWILSSSTVRYTLENSNTLV
jgi:hypothetical protein